MKIELKRADLAKALNLLLPVTQANKVLHILSNIKITFPNNIHMLLYAFDGTNSIEVLCDTIRQEGNCAGFLINCANVNALVKNISDSNIMIEVSEDEAKISYDAGETVFPIFCNTTEYPTGKTTDSKEIAKTTLPSSFLANALVKASVFTSSDEFHPQMQGINLKSINGGIYTCSTDTRKLVANKISVAIQDFSVIIPYTPITKALCSALSSEEICDAEIFKNYIKLSNSRFSCTVGLLNGNFPDFLRVIPSNANISCSCNVDKMCKSLARLLSYSDSLNSIGKFTFDPNGLTIQSLSEKMLIRGCERLDDVKTESTLTVGLNMAMLFNILKTLKGVQDITIKIVSPSHPIIIKNDVLKEETILLMPLSCEE